MQKAVGRSKWPKSQQCWEKHGDFSAPQKLDSCNDFKNHCPCKVYDVPVSAISHTPPFCSHPCVTGSA